MRILLLGPPGSGKGTIGKMLSSELNVPLIGAGKLLRELPKDYPNYDEINKLMNSGGLAPNEVVSDLMQKRLNEDDCKNGYIIDGYPRDIKQVKFFDPKLDVALLLKISIDTIYRRVMGRRICSTDGKVYNIFTLSDEAKNHKHCKTISSTDNIKELESKIPCSGKLTMRDDDNEKSLQERLEVYFKKTIKVNEHYRSLGKLIEIDGEPKPDEIIKNIKKALKP